MTPHLPACCAANARLALLSAQLCSEGAAAYASAKFEGMLGAAHDFTPEQLGARLPHARAWLAAASGQLPQVEQLAALHAGIRDDGSPAAPPQPQALPQLRAGLRAPSGIDSSGGAAQQQEALPLQSPVEARSWQGLVRLGLVQLVSGTSCCCPCSAPPLQLALLIRGSALGMAVPCPASLD